MKTKTPIKILTLTLFVTLISGFTLHKGGYLFTLEKKVKYISDPNGGAACEMKAFSQKDFGLNTFQKLKMSGAFDPELFDTMFILPIKEDHFLGSTKSMPVKFAFTVKEPKTFLGSQLKTSRKRKQ